MKKYLVIGALALSLAGCATQNGTVSFLPSVANPITSTRLVSIESAYAIALTGVNAYVQNYRDGHRCTVSAQESIANLCSRRSVVVKMQNAVRVSDAALGRAKTFINNNPNLDPTSVLDAAEAAVGLLTDISNNRS